MERLVLAMGDHAGLLEHPRPPAVHVGTPRVAVVVHDEHLPRRKVVPKGPQGHLHPIAATVRHEHWQDPQGVSNLATVLSYRARDTNLDRDVALKILPAAFAGDGERLQRFEREAKTRSSSSS